MLRRGSSESPGRAGGELALDPCLERGDRLWAAHAVPATDRCSLQVFMVCSRSQPSDLCDLTEKKHRVYRHY